jgi:hypothetical protein
MSECVELTVASETVIASAAAIPAPSGLRRIWLCADDYGLSHSVNTAIRDLVLQGRINATSVMVVTPTFKRSEALSLAILNAGTQRVAIGLHLTLTAPFKPLSTGYAPLRKEAFLPLKSTLRAALLRMLHPEKIAVEVAAQIKAFEAAFGRLPDLSTVISMFICFRRSATRCSMSPGIGCLMHGCGNAAGFRPSHAPATARPGCSIISAERFANAQKNSG